jgi:hypothetical protein
MDEKELQANAERYCELLVVYDGMLEALDAITKKITQTRKEILFLEELLQENGVKIKDVEIKEEKPE